MTTTQQYSRTGTSRVSVSAGTSGKGTVAPPKVTDHDAVELDAMGVTTEEAKLPLHDDIMQLSRLGEIGPVQKLLDENKYTANYKDVEGITPLHWAAINNHYALCKYLIERGAEVNAKGGESVATPVQWAVQRCNLYVVHLLLEHGADPLITDVQGYNLLHLATFDGNVFQLLIVLHQNVPVDIPDASGHTCLMWAAYKGFPACVDLLLRWGASVNGADENGYSTLHWALVKGNGACIHKLIEHGADRFAETNDGKTPAIVADEMNSKGVYHRALKDFGFNSDGTVKHLPLPYVSFVKTRSFLNRFFFLFPFFLIISIITLLSKMPVYVAVPITLFLAYSLQWVAQQILFWAPPDLKHLHRTPYLAGVFASSLFWVGVRWATKILKRTYSSHPILNLIFVSSYAICTYFYILAMTEDPGFVPKLSSRTQQKKTIYELLSLWKFDDQNYCAYCMTRRPLRSKHCKRCSRCVAKHDHHCPWIHNCVGANNLRHFVIYVIALEIGVLLFLALVVYYIYDLPQPSDPHCNVLSEDICQYVLRDPLTVVLSIWVFLQLVWVTMLLFVQLLQVARATTTFESMQSHADSSSQAANAITSALTAGSTSIEGASLTRTGTGPNPNIPSHNKHTRPQGCFEQWKKLLGLDTFVATATGRQARNRRNPFSRGIVSNCHDFWCDPAPVFKRRENGAAMLGGEVINYTRLYETPSRIKRQDHDRGTHHSVSSEEVV